MKKLSFLLCVCLCLSATALEISEVHEKVIENTVKHYSSILKQDFTVNINCPQIFGLINGMLFAQAKAAGAPANVPIPSISYVRRTHKASKNQDKYDIGWGRKLPKEMLAQAQDKIDSQLDAFGEMCSALTLDGLKDIAELASDNTCRLLQENPNQFVVTISGLDEEFTEGVKVIGANICFNKRFNTVDFVSLKLLGGKNIDITINHQKINGDNGNKYGAVPVRIVIKNNLQKQVGGMAIPPQLNFNLGNYNFASRGDMGM